MSSPVPQLRRRRLGVVHIVFFTVAASAPLTVLGGGVTTTFAVSGVTGVPLSFLILAAALALFAVGYAAMSRFVANAGAFYSYIAHGLGATWAVAGAFVALHLLQLDPDQPVRAVRGRVRRPGHHHDRGVAALVGVGPRRADRRRAPRGAPRRPQRQRPRRAAGPGVHRGGAVRHRRVRPPRRRATRSRPRCRRRRCSCRASARSSRSAWPRSSASSRARSTARRSATRGSRWPGPRSSPSGSPGCSTRCRRGPWSSRSAPPTCRSRPPRTGPASCSRAWPEHWGDGVATLANLLFLTSVFAALLSFHNGVARYLFALGRERVLPAALSRVGTRSGGPVAGSLAQSALALVVVAVFALSRGRPVLQMFTWLSGIGGGRRHPADGGHVGRGGRLLPRPTGRRVGVAAGGRPDARHDRAGRARRAADRQLRRPAGHRPHVAAALDPARPGAARGRRRARSGRRSSSRRGPTSTPRSAPRADRLDDDESVVLDLPPTSGRTSCGRSCSQTPGPGRGGQVSGVSRPRA